MGVVRLHLFRVPPLIQLEGLVSDVSSPSGVQPGQSPGRKRISLHLELQNIAAGGNGFGYIDATYASWFRLNAI